MTNKRLIEETFPLRQTSIDAVHEKNVRHGHISTLHIWPARRPLAAARAALLAALLPDPGTEEAREALANKIGGALITDPKTGKQITEGGVLHWTGDKEKARGIEMEKTLAEFRDEIRRANGGEAPRVLDMFAGGGAIPLEAMRLGCDVTAVDYNPVAWFLLKCTLDYPHRLAGKTWPLPPRDKQAKPTDKEAAFQEIAEDGDLAAHVRYWGQWVLERARADLKDYYPTLPLSPEEPEGPENPLCPTVAYLWARTVPHPDPQKNGLQVPLIKTLWLCKKAEDATENEDDAGTLRRKAWEKKRALRLVFNAAENRFDFEVFTPKSDDEVGQGTMGRGVVTCPPTTPGEIGLPLPPDYIQRCGKDGKLGAVCTAVVVGIPPKKAGSKQPPRKEYRPPTNAEREVAVRATDALPALALELPHGLPTEPLPPKETLGFRVPLYGLDRWDKLFTPRQLLALGTFVKHTRAARAEMNRVYGDAPDAKLLTEAVAAYLAVALDRLTDRSSTICRPDPSPAQSGVVNTFSRFALPMTWDFIEGVTTAWASGSYAGAFEFMGKVIEHCCSAAHGSDVAVLNRSAIDNIGVGGFDAIITDPPYYDAIPYADLSDFFYVWLRRTVGDQYGDVFAPPLTPKPGELVQHTGRGLSQADARKQYEDGMAEAFGAACRALKPDGRFVIVFAHKDPDAWETLVGAMIRAGFVITASWPIDTEMGNRTRAQNSAALSSSVWLVCRKRTPDAGRGNLARVRKEMQERIQERLRYFWDNGIRGADLVWAAVGPGLESYSQYETVSSMSGKPFAVKDFIAEVRRQTTDFTLKRLLKDGGVEGLDEFTAYALTHQQNFGMGVAPVGECILLAGAYGLDLNTLTGPRGILTKAKAKPKRATTDADGEAEEFEAGTEEGVGGSGSELRLKRWAERAQADLGEIHAAHGLPFIDMLHRLLRDWDGDNLRRVEAYLFQHNLANNEMFWRVAQAFAELPSTPDRSRIDTLMNKYKGVEINYIAPVDTEALKAPKPVTMVLPLYEEIAK